MWWREWGGGGRPELREAFLTGYGRTLSEVEAAGLRAEMKRDLMSSFSRRYFADMLADPGSKAGFRQVEDYDGHPKPLVDIWVPSSFCVDRARKKELAPRGEPPKPLRKAAAMDTKE